IGLVPCSGPSGRWPPWRLRLGAGSAASPYVSRADKITARSNPLSAALLTESLGGRTARENDRRTLLAGRRAITQGASNLGAFLRLIRPGVGICGLFDGYAESKGFELAHMTRTARAAWPRSKSSAP